MMIPAVKRRAETIPSDFAIKNDHFLLTIADDINHFLVPLKKKLNVNYFSYDLISPQRRICLTNYPQLLKFYYDTFCYTKTRIDFNTLSKARHFLPWNSLNQTEIDQEMIKHGVFNPIVITVSNQNSCELFNFGFSDPISDPFYFYAKFNDILNEFTIEFRKNARNLIIAAQQHWISLRGNDFLLKSSLTLDNLQKSMPSHSRFYLPYFEGTGVYLTLRELECIKWLSLGKTGSEVAIIMGISNRTANEHIKNIKSKFNCNTLFQLGKKVTDYHTLEFY